MFYPFRREWLPTPISCTGNCMDRGSWQAALHGFAKNQIRLTVLYFDFCGVWRYAVLCLVGQSSPTLCDPIDCSWTGSSVDGDSPGKNTEVGCHALLQGIFPTQGTNPSLPHCRWIFYHLRHQGSPWILEWVAYLFSRGSSWPRNQTWISWIAGRFFTSLETFIKTH